MALKLPATVLLCLVLGSSGLLDDSENLALKLNDFGYRLLLQLSKQEDNVGRNAVIGPTSLSGLLAMALMGTVGDTHNEIAQSIGFSQDILLNRKYHKAFGELLRVLAANDTSSKTIFADAIFVDAHAHVRPLYREFLQRVYGGDAVTVDFEDQNGTLSGINEWVKNQTQGVIADFLEQPLPQQSKAVLLSAHYFTGQWEKIFLPKYTKKMPFEKANGDVVMADLMLNFNNYPYVMADEQGFHMVEIPYNDSTTSMYVLKPCIPKKLALADLLATLEWAAIEQSFAKMKHEDTVLRFPKMKISTSAEMRPALKALGIESLFVDGKANFALMLEGRNENKTEEELITRLRNGGDCKGLKEKLESLQNPGLHVNKVIHDVKITIDEYGTEAVAVTAGIIGRTAHQFYMNTPFLFFIKDKRSGLVTFSAIINNPLE